MTNILDEGTQNPSHARSKYPTQLAKMSFDEFLDLTADVFFNFILGNVQDFPAEGGT